MDLSTLKKKNVRIKEKYKLLFVCLGNICRSPAAEAIFSEYVKKQGLNDLFLIDSAGTYGGHNGMQSDSRMRYAAAKRGIKLEHRARQIQREDFDKFDYILVMDDANYEDVYELAPSLEAGEKVIRMREFFKDPFYDYVPDPYYSGSEGFELVLNLLENSCPQLLEFVQKNKSLEHNNYK